MKLLRILLFTALITGVVSLMAATTVEAAWNPFGQVDCTGKAASSAVCLDKRNATEDPISGADGLIMNITNLVAVAAGIAAVIVIILSGLRFVTSGGGSEDVAGARRALIYAVVGLIVLVIARQLVAFIIVRI